MTRPTDALHTLEQVKPDLLVLDVGLPGMSGLELYDRLQKDERLCNVPVMFETAVSREHASEFKKRGIGMVLQKPFDLNELIAGVRKLAPPFAALAASRRACLGTLARLRDLPISSLVACELAIERPERVGVQRHDLQ